MFPVLSQSIAATPPLLSVKMAYRNPKTDLTIKGVSQKKLASEAYRAIGHHLSRRHLSVLIFFFIFIFAGGCTYEEEIRFR